MEGTCRSSNARPIVNTDIVAVSAINARMMVLDFKVIKAALWTPVPVTVRRPMENNGDPAVVKGSVNQRKRIKPLTMRRRVMTFRTESLARMIKMTAMTKAGIRAVKRLHTATTIENIAATTDLTLGSRR